MPGKGSGNGTGPKKQEPSITDVSSGDESGVPKGREPNKLILCFDGTGNQFSGSSGDTNVVKLLRMLDRNHPKQYHYYQTGIGTYSINESITNPSWPRRLWNTISRKIDEGIATTFDAHVIAGYRFLMRYYESDDKIYMFGFSRGAYTAKFLARMIHMVGLLCRGNEEMVPFALRLYMNYLSLARIMRAKGLDGSKTGDKASKPKATETTSTEEEDVDHDCDVSDTEFPYSADPTLLVPDGIPDDELSEEFKQAINKIKAFKHTFCRKDQRTNHDHEKNIKVYFLGLWDCVNSVAVLEQSAQQPVPVLGTARFVRHAVSVDERRVKFKPALLSQDIRIIKDMVKGDPSLARKNEDIKEVWFPGNHGDVGGGWPAEPPKNTWWQRIMMTDKPGDTPKDEKSDEFQLSDVALSWMIRELEIVGKMDSQASVKWSKKVDNFKTRFKDAKKQALNGTIHDPLKLGAGTAFFKVCFWWMLEIWPVTRWELKNGKWEPRSWPPNMGWTRDIPRDAVLHESLRLRLEKGDYVPANNQGDDTHPCLKRDGRIAQLKLLPPREYLHEEADIDHRTYTIAK